MNQAVTLRRAQADDALCLSALAIQVFLDTYATEGLRPVLAREAFGVYGVEAFAARLADPNIHILLAEHDGYLLGFADLEQATTPPSPVAAGGLELVRLYVQPQAQGKKLGPLLLAGSETLARELGLGHLWLTTWVGNTRARRFYPTQGYADVGTTYYRIEEQSFENRIFHKDLTPAR